MTFYLGEIKFRVSKKNGTYNAKIFKWSPQRSSLACRSMYSTVDVRRQLLMNFLISDCIFDVPEMANAENLSILL